MDVQEKLERPISRVLYRQSSVETRLAPLLPSDNDSDDEENKPQTSSSLRIVEEIKKVKPPVPSRKSSNNNEQSLNLDQDNEIGNILEKCLEESKMKTKPEEETQSVGLLKGNVIF